MRVRAVTSESGFTLVELLVAMAMAIPVIFALSAIMIVTLHQTQRSLTRVDATRHARTAMATIENELHSACVGQNVEPILAGSTPTSLQFLSYTGTSDTPTPVWHVLSVTGGALTDTTYPVVSAPGTTVGWVQATQPGTTTPQAGTTTTLLSNVAQLGTTPIFQYYAYKPYANGSVYDWVIPDGTNAAPGYATPPNSSLNAGGGLAASDAVSAVEVVVSLSVGATNQSGNNASLSGTSDPVTDAISLRLTTPPDSTTATNDTGDFGPCA